MASSQVEKHLEAKASCIFCAIAAGRAPARLLVQEEDALAFLDIRPAAPGHTLVIPRQHYGTIWEMDEAAGLAVARLALRVAAALRAALRPDGLTVVQNNGRAAGQEVPHAHWHLIPRWHGDGLRLARAPAAPQDTPLDEMARRIRHALGTPSSP